MFFDFFFCIFPILQFYWKAKPKQPTLRINITNNVTITRPAVYAHTAHLLEHKAVKHILQNIRSTSPNLGHLKNYHLIQTSFSYIF